MLHGHVTNLYVGEGSGVRKEPVPLLQIDETGIIGDKHAGLKKKADGRDKGIKRGTMIRNWRQWSAVSLEELDRIAHNLGVPSIDAAQLGANLCFDGIPQLTQCPVGALLRFADAILLVEAENDPCTLAGKSLKENYPDLSPNKFVKAALHLRGIVGTVYKPGIIRVGESVEIVLPEDQSRNRATNHSIEHLVSISAQLP